MVLLLSFFKDDSTNRSPLGFHHRLWPLLETKSDLHNNIYGLPLFWGYLQHLAGFFSIHVFLKNPSKGPGTGNLTLKLLNVASKVVAVEID